MRNSIQSKVMKAAHKIYKKSYKVKSIKNWSKALTRAWAWAKKTINKVSTKRFYFDQILRETEKAICFQVDRKIASGCYSSKNIWVPKSVINSIELSEVNVASWFGQKLISNGTLSLVECM